METVLLTPRSCRDLPLALHRPVIRELPRRQFIPRTENISEQSRKIRPAPDSTGEGRIFKKMETEVRLQSLGIEPGEFLIELPEGERHIPLSFPGTFGSPLRPDNLE